MIGTPYTTSSSSGSGNEIMSSNPNLNMNVGLLIMNGGKIPSSSSHMNNNSQNPQNPPSPTHSSSQSSLEILKKHGLLSSPDVLSILAKNFVNFRLFQQALIISKIVMEKDPYNIKIVPYYLVSLVALNKKSELFYTCHKLVEAYPQEAVSWYAVGCYYYVIGKFDQARKFFTKSTSLNGRYLPAWVGIGHSFFQMNDSDQAMSAYRTAYRLYSNNHLLPLFIANEYIKVCFQIFQFF